MNFKSSIFFAFIILLAPLLTSAQGYVPLVGIPGVTDTGISFNSYINALYALSISIAALLAVVKIIIAGMKWMLSDVVTNKSEAISDIKGAVFGLIVVVSAVLILTVINPQLTKTEIFLESVSDSVRSRGSATPGTPVTGQGFRSLSLTAASPETITAFSTACASVTGSVYRVEQAGTAVCYEPLPSSLVTKINNDFLGMPPANLTAVQRRFQTTHYPRLITDTSVIASKHDASEVLLAVSISNKNDWLDSANATAMQATCTDFQRSSGRSVTQVKGDNYLACIYKDDPNPPSPLGA